MLLTDFCMYAVSCASSGLIMENMSLWRLEPTGVTLTLSTFFTVLLTSGIMLKTPMEPVNVDASEKILSQLFDIQYPPDAA